MWAPAYVNGGRVGRRGSGAWPLVPVGLSTFSAYSRETRHLSSYWASDPVTRRAAREKALDALVGGLGAAVGVEQAAAREEGLDVDEVVPEHAGDPRARHQHRVQVLGPVGLLLGRPGVERDRLRGHAELGDDDRLAERLEALEHGHG